MKDFFISYNNADRRWAVWIAWVLESAGYSVVIQDWDFLPGENFVNRMNVAAREAERTIAVLSDDYLKAEYTQPEWMSAFRRDPTGEKRTLIPVRVRPFKPTDDLLSSVIYIDLVNFSEVDAERVLLGGLFSGRAKPAERPEFPAAIRGEAPALISEGPAEFPGPAGGGADASGAVVETADDGEPPHGSLSVEERRELAAGLKALSAGEFNILLFALDPPAGAVPPMPATQADRAAALLSWAAGPRGRGLVKVRAAFEKLKRSAEPSVGAEANLGVLVEKTCDREKQEGTFRRHLNVDGVVRPGFPQLYLVHGPEREGHASFVERLRETAVRDYALLHTAEETASVSFWELGWPTSGDLKIDGDHLVSMLLEKGRRRLRPGDFDEPARAFREVLAAEGEASTLVVQHRIAGEDLRPGLTGRLVERYLEFWDGLRDDGEATRVFVFLNVIYPPFRPEGFWPPRMVQERRHRQRLEAVRGELCALARLPGRDPALRPAPPRAFFAVLDELPCVRLEDVKLWFDKNKLSALAGRADRDSKEIYRSNGWDADSCRNMDDVELALHAFLNRIPTTGVHA